MTGSNRDEATVPIADAGPGPRTTSGAAAPNPPAAPPHTPSAAPGAQPAERLERWSSDRGRALVLPLAAMVAVVLIVAMSMIWPVDSQVVTAAVVGVITLAAALAGHAAGSSRSRG